MASHCKTLVGKLSGLIVVFSLVACGGGGGTGLAKAPNATVSPTLAVMRNDSPIILIFDKTMNPTSLILGGSLASESDGGVWSSTSNSNDTLTVSPTVSWTAGTRRALTIRAVAEDGERLDTVILRYDIASGTIYFVSSTASDDSGDGLSPATAKRTIKAAMDLANGPATVVVNGGNYPVNSNPGIKTHIVLKSGVSLYGGYNPSFSTRDTATYPSTITDMSTEDAGAFGSFNTVIESPFGITGYTYVDGFTLQGSLQNGPLNTYGIYCQSGTPTFENNIIHGGSGSDFSIGVQNDDGSKATMKYNIVHGGSSAAISIGIYNIGSESYARYNDIDGGSGATLSYGIYNNNIPLAFILDNTIRGGSGTRSYGIYNVSSFELSIGHNTIHGGSGSEESYGLYTNSAVSIALDNTIDGGSGGLNSYGVFIAASPTTALVNNTISGGSGNNSCGVCNFNTSPPALLNNTINGGSGSTATGIGLSSSSTADIVNNIVFTSTSGTGYCIEERDIDSGAIALLGNDLYGCGVLYFDADAGCGGNGDLDGDPGTCTLSEMALLTDFVNGVGENISIDPVFADIDGIDNNIDTMSDNDWHLTAASPAAVTTGGINITNSVSLDKDGNLRTAPMSIGAYEY